MKYRDGEVGGGGGGGQVSKVQLSKQVVQSVRVLGTCFPGKFGNVRQHKMFVNLQIKLIFSAYFYHYKCQVKNLRFRVFWICQ